MMYRGGHGNLMKDKQEISEFGIKCRQSPTKNSYGSACGNRWVDIIIDMQETQLALMTWHVASAPT
jgi:hypothetical protein